MWLMQNGLANPNNAGAAAYPYMTLMGTVSLGLMWLRMARASAAALAAGDDVGLPRTKPAPPRPRARPRRRRRRELPPHQARHRPLLRRAHHARHRRPQTQDRSRRREP